MKIQLLILALVGTLAASAQPAPRQVIPAEGLFRFGASTALTADEGLDDLARYAADHLACPVRPQAAGDGAIVLLRDASVGQAEAYRLEILPDRILVRGADYGGLFNGVQQLFRMLPAEVYARRGLPAGTTLRCATVVDSPRFPYRGMMLDVARTWIDVAGVKRYMDLLAYHSINKLHLHLSDDEGWRIEIRSHPELARIGGYRGGDSPVQAVYGKWSERYGGYYTHEDVRELVAYAAVRNIELIPEIDLPGHSRNIASVRPEIRCNYPPDTVSTVGYDYRSAWCVAREENYALLEDILGEVCALFPSEYIHVGGDEVDASQWERCPDCRALMRRQGLARAGELQGLFMQRVAAILERHGKRPAVWNEAADGRFTRRSRVYGWQSVAACLDATAAGYETVLMPGESFYFDMRQTPAEEGHDWAGVFDARRTFGFDPAARGFDAERMGRVAGLEGAFWSEAYVSHEPEKPDYLDYMCFPRICALARIAWSGNAEGWEHYYAALRREHYPRMAAMGIRFRLFPPTLRRTADGLLTLSTDDGAELWYTVDDGEPQRYTAPIRTAQPHRYRFFSRYGAARSPYVADKSYYRTIAPAVEISSSMGESSGFPYANAATYRGMTRTRRACRRQDWILYRFAEPLACRELYLQTGNRQLPKAILTTGYAEVSYDGTHFERAGELHQGSITLRPGRPLRAVRLVSTCDGNGTPFVSIQPPVVKPRL